MDIRGPDKKSNFSALSLIAIHQMPDADGTTLIEFPAAYFDCGVRVSISRNSLWSPVTFLSFLIISAIYSGLK